MLIPLPNFSIFAVYALTLRLSFFFLNHAFTSPLYSEFSITSAHSTFCHYPPSHCMDELTLAPTFNAISFQRTILCSFNRIQPAHWSSHFFLSSITKGSFFPWLLGSPVPARILLLRANTCPFTIFLPTIQGPKKYLVKLIIWSIAFGVHNKVYSTMERSRLSDGFAIHQEHPQFLVPCHLNSQSSLLHGSIAQPKHEEQYLSISSGEVAALEI